MSSNYSILFNDKREFCQGFFHVDESREWSQNITCLCVSAGDSKKEQSECIKMTVHAIAHVWAIFIPKKGQNFDKTSPTKDNRQIRQEKGKTLFVKKYQNQYKGDSKANIHCEELIRSDGDLLKCLTQNYQQAQIMLTLYISYQPCHRSAGGRNLQGVHTKSCSELLQHWWLTFLKPLGIVFRIKCINIYRAHWENKQLFDNEKDALIFEQRVQNARDGLRILIQNGILVQAMKLADWYFLFRLCNRKIVLSLMTEEKWQKRRNCDSHIDKFLSKFPMKREDS